MRTKTLSLIALLLLVASTVFAAPSVHTNVGKNLNPAQCDTSGPPVLNITFKIINDGDSGVMGNTWANDSINRRIQVWKQVDGTNCAVVRDEGQFVTNAGPSPNSNLLNPTTVGAGVKGTMSGGYMAIFAGTLADGVQTHGNLGTFDYQCTTVACPNVFNWRAKYFPNNTLFDMTYWAWEYRAGRNGVWVNARTGNYGDITGN